LFIQKLRKVIDDAPATTNESPRKLLSLIKESMKDQVNSQSKLDLLVKCNIIEQIQRNNKRKWCLAGASSATRFKFAQFVLQQTARIFHLEHLDVS
jgi:hypothetical protein